MLDYDGQPTLDYAPCRYGTSTVDFRGPQRSVDAPYIACLGGTEFYGKYLHRPIPDLLEADLGTPCVNLGRTNAGVDVFANDPEVMAIASAARVAVVQITGVHNISNRFYSVHPRRNDRFIAPSELLRAVFPEVDFTAVHFTRHLLQELRRVSPSRFKVVVDELKAAWVARMAQMLSQIAAPTLLFWMGDQGPQDGRVSGVRDPLYVDAEMLEFLRPQVDGIISCVVSDKAKPPELDEMVWRGDEIGSAKSMFGPKAHAEAASALADPIRVLLETQVAMSGPRYA